MKKKYSLIIGGSGNIGKRISYLVQLKGYTVIILDKNKPKENFNYFYKVNLENLKLVEKKSKEICKKFPKIDMLINCAAMVGSNDLKGWNTEFKNQSIEAWNSCLNTNLSSAFLITKNILPSMYKTLNPKIINISSIYGSCAPRKEIYRGTNINSILAYAVSKGGLEIMTKWLSSYLDKKFSVNSIAFGGLLANQNQKFIKRYSKFTFKKRMMTLNDIEPVINYLIDDKQTYVTGQNLFVDGGWSTF